jgi:hypothetical protein
VTDIDDMQAYHPAVLDYLTTGRSVPKDLKRQAQAEIQRRADAAAQHEADLHRADAERAAVRTENDRRIGTGELIEVRNPNGGGSWFMERADHDRLTARGENIDQRAARVARREFDKLLDRWQTERAAD